MGYSTGRGSFASTGSQTVNTNLTGAPTGGRITMTGKNSDTVNHGTVGTFDGTHQNVSYWSPTSSNGNNTEVLLLKDATGTTIVEASWTSFGTSGSNGTVTFNVTTVSTLYSYTLEVWN